MAAKRTDSAHYCILREFFTVVPLSHTDSESRRTQTQGLLFQPGEKEEYPCPSLTWKHTNARLKP
jgi:hypothetical protein